MIPWLRHRWLALPDEDKVHVHGLMLCGAVFLFHYGLHSWWYIEDAAISFSFARNAALGEGLVAYPGGAPVEGFSNPSWTLLLVFFRLLGVSPFIAAKLLGAVLGLATLPLAWAWARRLMGGRDAGRWPLLVPLLLAVSPQFVLWCASGLENPLFTFLIALGGLWILQEIEEGTSVRSAVPWVVLAITRPEAPLYMAVAGVLAIAFAVQKRGVRAAWRWGLRWGLAVSVPFLLWHAVRIAYFAWPWPNTYYAKLAAQDTFEPLKWGSDWNYLRSWALETGQGFLLPVYLLGQTGARRRRWWAGVALWAVLWLLWIPGLWWPGQIWSGWKALHEPHWLVAMRVVAMATVALLAPGLGLDRKGAPGRVLAWMLTLVGLFFALYSGGDWMDGFRWINPVIVPLCVLYADGLREVAAALGDTARLRRLVRPVAVVLAGIPLTIYTIRSGFRVALPEIGPYDVRWRVVYMQNVAERLGLEHPSQMEVDMGANMWWSGFSLIDMAGLVDVPIGHHTWQIPFMRQYVYQERQPNFAHVHGFWQGKTNMARVLPEWKRYLELPGVPVSRSMLHPGNRIDRRLFIKHAWDGSDARRTTFSGGPELTGLDLPVPEVAPGGTLYVRLGWRRPGPMPRFRAWLFLSGPQGVLHAWELPPGYDWTDPLKWANDEVYVGNHALPIPADMPLGTWDLGLVVAGEGAHGPVLPARDIPPGSTIAHAAFARGEVRWVKAVTIVGADHARQQADAALQDALSAAAAGRCARAEDAWEQARRHLAPHDAWQARARTRIARPLARCYAGWAAAVGGDGAVPALLKAREWDHRDPVVEGVCEHVADGLVAVGDAAEARQDDEDAYDAWRDALRVDPRRTWVRRRAESARDQVLHLHPPDR